MRSSTRIAIVGAGRIVERIHLPVLSARRDIVIGGIAEPDAKRRTQLAHRFPQYSYVSEADAIWEYLPDLVVIATPNCFHAKLAIQALRRNVSVWCEKPAAVSAVELRDLQQAQRHSAAVLAISSPNRYRIETLALKRLIDSQTIGRVERIHLAWERARGIPGVGSWFTNRALAGGGAAIDLGSHLFDVGFWLMHASGVTKTMGVLRYPTAESAQRAATWYYPAVEHAGGLFDVEVGAAGEVGFDDGRTLSFETSWESDRKHDLTTIAVDGSDGCARLQTLFGFAPTPMTSSTLEWNGRGHRRGTKSWPREPAPRAFERQWTVCLNARRPGQANETGAALSLSANEALLRFYENAARETTLPTAGPTLHANVH